MTKLEKKVLSLDTYNYPIHFLADFMNESDFHIGGQASLLVAVRTWRNYGYHRSYCAAVVSVRSGFDFFRLFWFPHSKAFHELHKTEGPVEDRRNHLHGPYLQL